MELAVFQISGQQTARTVMLDESIFGIEPNDHAIYLDTKQFMANQRQGTHCTKEKSMVSGSTRKIKRQKGTGGARAGSIKSPLFRGGARIFGPQPRDYAFKLNKKVKRLARKSALTYKVKENQIIVLEDFDFEAPRTKSFVELLNNFSVAGKKTMFVLARPNRNVLLSSRNIQQVKVIQATDLNTYDILNARQLFVTESSLPEIEKVLTR
ncbi:MAG TPA: 50S ribosomal protein L4 [Bacteroidales bacterium]|nr:50S ribosomal protein L4 [Bacteroidales bacterium]